MPERVADAIEEIARPNRDEQPEKPQIHADPGLRRPRLMRSTPGPILVAMIVAVGVLAGWGAYWLLGFLAAPDGAGLSRVGRPLVRIPIAVVVALLIAVLVAWTFRPVQTLRRAARSSAVAVRRRPARLSLFVAVSVAVVVGACLGVLTSRVFAGVFFPPAATTDDVLKTALPATAGAALAVALVVVFRRQKDSERARFAQRCGAASAQLGDSDVAVRIAGVYGMAAIADESSTFAHRQQCIDVLCGYLRLPYDPDWGSSHLTEFVSTTTWSATPPATNIEEQRRQAVRQNDREVRKTIVRVIVRHLQDNADVSWSGNDFDFTDVLFEGASFAGATFNGRRVSFAGAVFRGDTTAFDGVDFNSEIVTFHETRFESDHTTFADAAFRARYTTFEGAAFGGDDVSFEGATFGGEYVFFDGASFGAGETSFAATRFTCLRASFDSPEEWNQVDFDWDNAPSGSTQAPPRCITPRPWPPYLAGEELGSR
jgi:hypothetical protein